MSSEIIKPCSFDDVPMDGVEGVLLDLDDTLYRYQPCHDAAIEASHALHSFGMPLAAYRTHYRRARDEVTARLAPQAACRSRLLTFQLMAETFDVRQSFDTALLLDTTYWSTFLSQMAIDKSAFAFLMRCAELGHPTCIVTDMTAHVQIRKITQLRIAELISFLVTSEEVGAEKPNAKMFLTAAKKLGIEPAKCIMLGDSVNKDIVGAQSAGMTAYLIALCDD